MMASPPSELSRRFALLVLVCAVASLGTQFVVSQAQMGVPPLAVLWRMAGYFTVLTNLAVAITMLALVARVEVGPQLAAALLLAILMVGIVYHLVLARLWAPQGLAWWADQGLHSLVPLLTLFWWLRFAPKKPGLTTVPLLLIWPSIYVLYALLRGSLSGFWPYPFIDADRLGYRQVWVNIFGLEVAAAGLGAAILLLGGWLAYRTKD